MCRKLIMICVTLLGLLPALARSQKPSSSEFWGFTGPWDRESDASVRANAHRLRVVVSGWIGLDSTTARPLLPSPYPDTIRSSARAAQRMAIVTSWHGDRFHPNTIRSLARHPRLLSSTASAIANHAKRMKYTGLVLDFEALEPSDFTALRTVVRTIADSARANGVRTIALAIPALDTLGYPTRPLLELVDVVIPMLYDQHWSTSEPGPISAPNWVRQALAMRLRGVDPSRVVAGLPVYGYRWLNGQRAAEDISFADARRVSDEAGVALSRDSGSSTLRAKKPGEWELWVSDADLLRRLVADAESLGVRQFALWRLGQEDEEVWGTVVRPSRGR